jgi:hypothetical protein
MTNKSKSGKRSNDPKSRETNWINSQKQQTNEQTCHPPRPTEQPTLVTAKLGFEVDFD